MSSPALVEYYQPTEFRVGKVLSRSFTVLRKHFVLFLGVCAAAGLPGLALLLLIYERPDLFWLGWALVLWGLLLNAICQALLVFGAFQDLRGRPVRAMESVSYGLKRFGPVLLTSACVAIAEILGVVLLIIPGMILGVLLSVSLPACVVEKLGPFASMKRSYELANGYGWPIFGVLFLIGLADAVINGILSAMHSQSIVIVFVQFAIRIAITAYTAVVAAIIYHDLRVLKEGTDIEKIASVFE